MKTKPICLFLVCIFLLSNAIPACSLAKEPLSDDSQTKSQSTVTITPEAITTPLTPKPDLSPTSPQLLMVPDAAWDLVVIGDSSMWRLANAYADQIEQDLGVKVLVHEWTIGGLEAGKVLQALQTGEMLFGLQDNLRDAEIVVMFVNPRLSINPDKPLDLEGCFVYKMPGDCGMDTFEKYIADLEAIWSEIFKLRAVQPVILRATDIYNPLVTNWQQNGVFEACTECWVNMSEANRIAAETYNIPFLSRLTAFNGPNFTDNPREKGYIAKDGEHPTELMGQYTAELLSKMGYQPVIPPHEGDE